MFFRKNWSHRATSIHNHYRLSYLPLLKGCFINVSLCQSTPDTFLKIVVGLERACDTIQTNEMIGEFFCRSIRMVLILKSKPGLNQPLMSQ